MQLRICSHLASFNMLPLGLGALHGPPPSNGTNWHVKQATGEGKSGLVETGLTGPC